MVPHLGKMLVCKPIKMNSKRTQVRAPGDILIFNRHLPVRIWKWNLEVSCLCVLSYDWRIKYCIWHKPYIITPCGKLFTYLNAHPPTYPCGDLPCSTAKPFSSKLKQSFNYWHQFITFKVTHVCSTLHMPHVTHSFYHNAPPASNDGGSNALTFCGACSVGNLIVFLNLLDYMKLLRGWGRSEGLGINCFDLWLQKSWMLFCVLTESAHY